MKLHVILVNVRRNVSLERMTHAQITEEKRVTADQHARGYNHGGRQTSADNILASESAGCFPVRHVGLDVPAIHEC
ncbi:hypothetical protein TNCV_279731 [Trichonephila clavipes]|nr:hypothetical protein TNCV_279731 [Trichonephila clavipes]